MRKLISPLFIGLIIIAFFWQFFIKGLIPVPADTIVGLYHPFRDLYAKNYPNGIPFKNFLITDPVRQQYLWRELVIDIEKRMELPLWNPYNFSGTPILANFQSASFYPLNILFFVMPFTIAWSLMIFLGPLLAGLFLFLYLNNLKLNKWACLLGAITFSFSGFFISWLEWGTITHVALWLPLILLSIDKMVSSIKYQVLSIKNREFLTWSIVYLFSITSSFLAGHLQTFFYLFIFSWVYFFARWFQSGWKKKILFLFIFLNSLFIILTVIQWIPTLQLIQLSARNIDQINFNNPGWFIPWQHLIQFVTPDFFGNPTTLNYWGVWNYGEFVGYVGITPLIFALFSSFFRRDKKTLFFGTLLFLSLIFSLPTFFAKIPYLFKIPFLNTAQPTRLLFITTFSMSVLAALGFDYYLKNKKKIVFPLVFVGIIFACLWSFVMFSSNSSNLSSNISVAKNNLIFPSIIMLASIILLSLSIIIPKLNFKFYRITYPFIILLVIFDLFRFAWKFTPFTDKDYLFPETKTISFLQKTLGNNRIMTTDSRILPPNFSAIYRLQSVDGYDPLYLRRYGEFVAASERGEPNISPPFGFNRIIAPHNYNSKIIDLLGVKYILSLSDLSSEKLIKVFQEGKTRIYENKNAFPRAFFVEQTQFASSKKEAIELMFHEDFELRKSAVIEDSLGVLANSPPRCTNCSVKIIEYAENRVIVETKNDNNGFLVLTDSFYPTWKVKIDGMNARIYRVDYNFRGIIVPKGVHTVEFYNSLF